MRGGGSGDGTGGTCQTPPGGHPTGWYRQEHNPPRIYGKGQFKQRMPNPPEMSIRHL